MEKTEWERARHIGQTLCLRLGWSLVGSLLVGA